MYIVLAVVAILVVLMVLYLAKNKTPQYDDELQEIVPYVYLGSEKAMKPSLLAKYNIQNVLNVTPKADDDIPGILNKQISVYDDIHQDLLSYFNISNHFIDDAVNRNQNVLIRCKAGISRSATFVAAYLMWKRKISAIDALKIISEKRSIISPNPSFLKQLEKYQTFM